MDLTDLDMLTTAPASLILTKQNTLTNTSKVDYVEPLLFNLYKMAICDFSWNYVLQWLHSLVQTLTYHIWQGLFGLSVGLNIHFVNKLLLDVLLAVLFLLRQS